MWRSIFEICTRASFQCDNPLLRQFHGKTTLNRALLQIVWGLIGAALTSTASAQELLWLNLYPGPQDEYANACIEASQGGYVACGSTSPYTTCEMLVIRTDVYGDTLWSAILGGQTAPSTGYALLQTPDGGFLIAGCTYSGDEYSNDGWLVKLDASGSLLWDRVIGTVKDDWFYSMCPTSDGGYCLLGCTGYYPLMDFWVVRVDSVGVVEWQTSFGGTQDDAGFSISPSGDGGFITAGRTSSYGAGANDGWLVKINSLGGIEWDLVLGKANTDIFRSVEQTTDGGYIACGFTNGWTAGRDFDDIRAGQAWLVKTDDAGGIEWDRSYSISPYLRRVISFADGYLLAGNSDVAEGNIFLAGTDSEGSIIWDFNCGGPGSEIPHDLCLTSDNGFLIAGEGRATQYSDWEFMLAKISEPTGIASPEEPGNISLLCRAYPNPFAQTCSIILELPETGPARADVFDQAGRVVATLIDEAVPAGTSVIEWDGCDAEGSPLPSGCYLLRLAACGLEAHAHLVMLGE